jgi:predicted ATP-binding protein involved in virulence
MKIRKLQLKNIGVFDDETIEFQPCSVKDKAEIHIFTGQNGSGKSTLLMTLASNYDYFRDFKDFPRDVTPYTLSNKLHKRFREKAILTISSDYIAIDGIIKRKTNIYKDPHSKFVHGSHSPGDFYYQAVNSERWAYKTAQFHYAVFAFSGYRRISDERVEAIKEPENFNPLYQSLEFIKDYNLQNQLTINQLIANNISKSGIEHQKGNLNRSERFARTVIQIEEIISEITGWKVEFDLETEPTNLITKINGEELDFDVLPDGLRSLISWIADLLGRVDLLKWQDDLPIFEKNLILLLDEIEVHLHPAWQRKVLPVVQKLFKNSQIFVSTHSPFVVNSIDDAWVYKLELENGKAKVAEVIKSEDGFSYSHVLSEIFDIEEEFGVGVQKDLAKFKELRNKILATKNGSDKNQKELLQLAKSLAVQSEELQTIVQFELRQLNKRIGKNLTI